MKERPVVKDPIEKLEEEIRKAQMRQELTRLSDETVVPLSVAALFLGLHEKSVQKRVYNNELNVIKYAMKGSVTFNQCMKFKMGELRAYQNKHTYKGTYDQLIKRGF